MNRTAAGPCRHAVRPVHYRRLRQPPTIWLQPMPVARYGDPSGRTPLHASILLAAVAIGILLAVVIASAIKSRFGVGA